jgi:hypothetical protein
LRRKRRVFFTFSPAPRRGEHSFKKIGNFFYRIPRQPDGRGHILRSSKKLSDPGHARSGNNGPAAPRGRGRGNRVFGDRENTCFGALWALFLAPSRLRPGRCRAAEKILIIFSAPGPGT